MNKQCWNDSIIYKPYFYPIIKQVFNIYCNRMVKPMPKKKRLFLKGIK